MNRNTLVCLVLFPTWASCIAASAQTEAEPPPASGPLSGPVVAEQRIEGVESGFSSMTAQGRMAQPVPMPVFRRALAELAGESAPEGARLSEQQVERLRALQGEHRRAQGAFRRQHAAEFRELREALGPALAERLDRSTDRARPERRRTGPTDRRPESAPERRQGDRAEADRMRGDAGPKAGDDRPEQSGRPAAGLASRADLTDAQRAAMARLRELWSQAPGVEGLQTKIWAELTEPQQAHVQSRIDEHRKEMTERRAAAYVERMMAQRTAGERGGPEGPARPRAEAIAGLAPELRETLESLPDPLRQRVAQLPPERLQRLLERLARLTPEERAQALRRMARDRRSGRPAEGAVDRADRSTPPPVEDLKVPRPDGNR